MAEIQHHARIDTNVCTKLILQKVCMLHYAFNLQLTYQDKLKFSEYAFIHYIFFVHCNSITQKGWQLVDQEGVCGTLAAG